LALRDQLGDGCHRLLDRDGRIDAVEVIEVDVIDPETAQRRRARLMDVRRVTTEGAFFATRAADDPELGGQLDPVTATADRSPDQLLVGVGPIYVRRVEEGDPEVEGTVD